MSLWYNLKRKNYGFGLIRIETIVGLGLIGTKAIVILWCYVRAENIWWWHGFRRREALLEMGADAEAVDVTERWDNDVVRQRVWQICVVWFCGDVQRRGSGALN